MPQKYAKVAIIELANIVKISVVVSGIIEDDEEPSFALYNDHEKDAIIYPLYNNYN